MLAFWQAFQKLRTEGQTERRIMYIDVREGVNVKINQHLKMTVTYHLLVVK